MLINLLFLSLTIILFIASLVMLKNSIAIKKEVIEQLESISEDPDVFEAFFDV